jgi:hypothetical protein
VAERDLVGVAPDIVRIADGTVVRALQPLGGAVSNARTNVRGSVTLDAVALSVDVEGDVV